MQALLVFNLANRNRSQPNPLRNVTYRFLDSCIPAAAEMSYKNTWPDNPYPTLKKLTSTSFLW